MKTLLLFAFMITGIFGYTQKFDGTWQFGYNYFGNTPEAEAFDIIFDTFPPRIDSTIIRYAFFLPGYSSICDSSGQIRAYSNTCTIYGPGDERMEEGETMTSGWELEWCNLYRDHPYHFYTFFLPHPDTPHLLYYFYKTTYKSETPPLVIYQDKLLYAVLDMNANSGEGEVISKNNLLLGNPDAGDVRLGYGQMTAVKHGNGRDWWMPIPEDVGNGIYMIRIAAEGISVSGKQELGPPWNSSGGFQASFSPDGSRYVRYNRFHGVYIYDFDRCSGVFTQIKHFPFNDTTQGLYGGCAISPNNRYLYIADFDYVYQFDLWAADIPASKQLVAVYDGFMFNLWTKFSYIVNAPDGRMYIIPPNTTKAMHVINRPDLEGAACHLKQHDLLFPYAYANPPNFPNFGLGPLDDSPCDTLGLNNLPSADFRPDLSDTSSRTFQFWDISAYAPDAWQWDFGDPLSAANTSQEQHPLHTFSAPGFYTVCLTASNAYAADTRCKVVEVQAVSAPEADDAAAALHVYPNPTTGILHLPPGGGRERLAELFDWSGRRVFAATTVEDRLDLGRQAPGVYLLRLTQPDGRQVRQARIMIQRD